MLTEQQKDTIETLRYINSEVNDDHAKVVSFLIAMIDILEADNYNVELDKLQRENKTLKAENERMKQADDWARWN